MNFIPLIILALMLSVSPCEASSPKKDTKVLTTVKNAPKASVRDNKGRKKECKTMIDKKTKKSYIVCPK